MKFFCLYIDFESRNKNKNQKYTQEILMDGNKAVIMLNAIQLNPIQLNVIVSTIIKIVLLIITYIRQPNNLSLWRGKNKKELKKELQKELQKR